MRTPTTILLAIALLATSAFGADTGIQGTKLVLKSRGSTYKLVFVSKDATMPFPAIGSVDDPSTGGMVIDLVTPAALGQMAIPGGLGNPGWKTQDGAVDSYTYRNGAAPAGPSFVRSLSLRQGRVLKVTARSVGVAMTSPLGSVGIRFRMGSTRACALFDGATIVADAPGTFSARNATVRPGDCTNTSLGFGPPVCGDGAVNGDEQCELTSDAACPGLCTPECTCVVPCDDGELDPGEECDGQAFGPAPACTIEPGLASPRCRADCTCCQTLACSGPNFDFPCCPGLACPNRIGPHDYAFCRPSCETSDDCQGNQICVDHICRTPTCTSNAQCPMTPYGQSVCAGVCCVAGPFGIYCDG